MRQSYPAILPTPLSSTRALGATAEGDDHRLPTRRRHNVRVACNNCRTKKAACNGRRPTCSRCDQFNLICEYVSATQDETPRMVLKNELQQVRGELMKHVEILDHLQTLPESEAIEVLRHLRLTGSITSVLSSIARGACSLVQPSAISTARAMQPPTDSGVEFELSVLHPAAYPALVPLDLDSIDLDALFSSSPRSLMFGRPITADVPDSVDGLATSSIPESLHPSPLRGVRSGRISPVAGPVRDRQYCDRRLSFLNATYWTAIPISNEFAASVLSNYLENYHPIFACFDPDLFLSDLVDQKLENCSAFLFSALMSFACRSYSAFDLRSSIFSVAFLEDAEKLYRAERKFETPLSLAAMCYLQQAAMMSGKDDLVTSLTRSIRELGVEMKFFGVGPNEEPVKAFDRLSPQQFRQLGYIAWGVYGWITLLGTFFEVEPIQFQPEFPIPGGRGNGPIRSASSGNLVPSYMGQTFTTLCKFWTIVQGISMAFTSSNDVPVAERVPIAVAEGKYQQLLTWADSLHPEMFRGKQNPSHVLFFHAVYHCAVITLFRPYKDMNQTLRLHSFSSLDSTPSAIFFASLNQLKRLLYEFHTQTSMTSHCVWFNAASILISSAMLKDTAQHPQWRSYLRLCLQFWKESYVRYPIILLVAQANLSLALQTGDLTGNEAKRMMREVRNVGLHHIQPEQASTSAVIEFGTVSSSSQEEKMDVLARRFDELVMFDELTTGDLEEPQEELNW